MSAQNTQGAAQGAGQSGGLAHRYARALLGFVKKDPNPEAQLKQTEDALQYLKQALESEPKLVRSLASPQLSTQQQQAILAEIEPNLNSATKQLLRLLVQNRRINLLAQITEAALAELARQRGEVTAYVQSAQPLSHEEQERLVRILARAIGRTPRLAIEQDPSLLAGFIVQLESRRFDGSLKGKLDRLQLAFNANQ